MKEQGNANALCYHTVLLNGYGVFVVFAGGLVSRSVVFKSVRMLTLDWLGVQNQAAKL